MDVSKIDIGKIASMCPLGRTESLGEVIRDLTRSLESLTFEPGDRRIIVVDSDEPVWYLLKTSLEEVGYNVTRVGTPEEAKRLEDLYQYDLAISEIDFPEAKGAGYELCTELDKHKPTIPVILLTYRNKDEDIRRGWEAGCSAYLTKPVDPVEVIVFVSKIFDTLNEN